ncbi:MAG TPA: pyridoxamine 5'-phosphate oxidase family protein [Candidatus Dormibacteraeota bacterium]|nr:pyridoxamine 5'-phosphate oxidase family protein [Candidatus Dormibacteraeota bacterium]
MTEKVVADGAMEVLTEEQCVQLLELHDLGRVALQVGDQPEVFPVSYATDGEIVVFRTARGTRLDQATECRIAFEVDDWDPHTGVGWSVMLKGVAEEVKHGSDPFTAALRSRPVKPLAPGERDLLLAIYPAEISGRRFRKS